MTCTKCSRTLDSLALTVAPDGNVYCKVIENHLYLFVTTQIKKEDRFQLVFLKKILRYAIRSLLHQNVLKLSLIQVKFLPMMKKMVAQDAVERYYIYLINKKNSVKLINFTEFLIKINAWFMDIGLSSIGSFLNFSKNNY